MKKFLCTACSAFIAISFHFAIDASGEPKFSGTRPPAVAGTFYSSDPEKLERVVRQFLQDSTAFPMEDPIAVIVPHAGYIYSGQICADAYRQVMNRQYDVFVLLGVNHTTGGFRGISVADYERYRTPLGDIPIDTTIAETLLNECEDCVPSREVHVREHSIEVQIPFIQVLFPYAKIVPLIIHPPEPDLCIRFGKTLAGVLKNKNALIIISTDLSHYPSSDDAVRADRLTLETIAGLDTGKIVSIMKRLDIPNLGTRACGEAAILAGITAAGKLGARRAVVTGYSNSGETAIGDRNRAVGYGAVAITHGNGRSDTHILNRPVPPATASPLNHEEKKSLLEFARKTIRQYLALETLPPARNFSARLDFRQGAFVTIKKEDQLRGCIGNILPEDGLARTVGRVALKAALEDPRFRPVELKELDDLEIEISVLTPLKPVTDPERIVPGRDGVILIKEGNSAVFLPQVAPENNWDRTEMLDHLCLKARLPEGCWKENARFEIFQADVFNEDLLSGQ